MKDKQSRFILMLGLISLMGVFGLVQLTSAQSLLPACTATGNCTICDIVQTGINIGGAIIAIVGSLILLMFVYGGVLWLISAGRPDYVKKGKDVLINSIIGLAIIMTSYLAVTAVISVITAGSSGQEWNWQGKLTCVPIDFSPKPPDNAANLTDTINVPPDDYGGAGGTGLGAGSPCTKNEDCKGFCGNIDDELLKDYNKSDGGKNKIEKGKCSDKLPANAECESAAMENDDIACASGKCADRPGFKDYCYGEALKKAGDTCTKDDECQGFCVKASGNFLKDVENKDQGYFPLEKEKCHDKLGPFNECTDVAMNDDDNACASKNCKGWVGKEYCKGGAVAIGQTCRNSADCAAGFCAKITSSTLRIRNSTSFVTPPLEVGHCHALLPNDAQCQGAAMNNDDYACASQDCDDELWGDEWCEGDGVDHD